MGFIGGMLGTAGGADGTGFAGPKNASIAAPTTAAQATNSYNQSQNALTQQQQFLNAVQAQNGLQNQSNVLNQLQGVANGTGPNPAQAQLAQSTGANVANQAALMAGQRGSSQNAGLIARQAAQQGAQTQQQSAGQAATLQANQSLNALGQMGGLATSQAQQQAAATGALNTASQGEQGQLLGAIQGQNQAQVGAQSSVNAANAGLASTSMGQQGNLLGGITGGIGSALGLAHGGKVPQKMANGGPPGSYSAVDPNNNPFSQPPAPTTAPVAAPTIQSASPTTPQVTKTQSGPQSNVGKAMSGTPTGAALTGTSSIGNTLGKGIGAGLGALFGSGNGPAGSATNMSDDQQQQAYLDADAALSVPGGNQETEMPASNQDPSALAAAKGGTIPVILSPGEKHLSKAQAKKAAEGKLNPMAAGKTVPGKPKVPGAVDDYANDTYKTTAQEGDIIIPRSITQGPNPHWESMRFVHSEMKKRKAKGGKV